MYAASGGELDPKRLKSITPLTVFLGPNGSGKSTYLMSLLSSLNVLLLV
ncbi:ATPase domain protein [Microcystis aeruginosa FACHB-905 = DIANCHI905]|uniref:ATPase AAA-type core domain-containing protein n=1 Tax=Microcystis aeruginosa PCC 7806SL TaxID=1903187 RepID=A0AB33BVN1_MICA7|nr:hypothetical protein BH695_1015 [Microcystis aeruginosa PCC 7806SL]ELS48224.1 ATPase domain protein [Microcystis aeruginosa FACHB-905 = DIANCHI905]ELS48226.1 ATPase domain protein [Microcystis aeruginosa FACHB-905 = DIANCHI905]